MTCGRYGWINTGSLVAFWPIACRKHNIPSSKSIHCLVSQLNFSFEPINYNINLHLTEEHVDHDVENVYQEMIIYISAVSFSCSNSPQITTVFVATIPQQHLLLMHYKQCSALHQKGQCFLGEHPSISLQLLLHFAQFSRAALI